MKKRGIIMKTNEAGRSHIMHMPGPAMALTLAASPFFHRTQSGPACQDGWFMGDLIQYFPIS
jgi:hypothetical protein